MTLSLFNSMLKTYVPQTLSNWIVLIPIPIDFSAFSRMH